MVLQCKKLLESDRYQQIEKWVSEASAIEVEIGAADSIMELFDTANGTLEPVLRGTQLNRIPADLLKALTYFAGTEDKILSIPWDVLSYEEKRNLLMFAAKDRNHNFFKNRQVPGLRYRSQINLKFPEKNSPVQLCV